MPLRGEHDVRTLVRQGSPAHALHDAAEQLGAAAVVVGSTHHGRVGRVVAGDVAAGLLHGAPCPVAVAPRGFADDAVPGRIAVAYTDMPESRAALATATELAERTSGTISVLSVVEPIDWTGAAAAPAAGLDARHRGRAARVRRADGRRGARHVAGARPRGRRGALGGTAVDELAAASERFELLVCGSRGYGALRSVLAGGVSRGLAHTARCPLLVVPRSDAAPATSTAA